MRLAWKTTGSCGKFRRPRTQQLLGGPRRPRRPRYHRYHSVASHFRCRFRHFLGSPWRRFRLCNAISAISFRRLTLKQLINGPRGDLERSRQEMGFHCMWVANFGLACFCFNCISAEVVLLSKELKKCIPLCFHFGWLSCPSPHLGMHLDMSHVLFNSKSLQGNYQTVSNCRIIILSIKSIDQFTCL